MEIEEMSIMDLKTILEMIVIILEGSKDKDDKTLHYSCVFLVCYSC